jgi:hypothetical protein
MTARPGRHEKPLHSHRPPGVACPADAKGKMAYTHFAQIHPAGFPWPPMHRQFATAEPARQTILGAMRCGSNRLRTVGSLRLGLGRHGARRARRSGTGRPGGQGR